MLDDFRNTLKITFIGILIVAVGILMYNTAVNLTKSSMKKMEQVLNEVSDKNTVVSAPTANTKPSVSTNNNTTSDSVLSATSKNTVSGDIPISIIIVVISVVLSYSYITREYKSDYVDRKLEELKELNELDKQCKAEAEVAELLDGHKTFADKELEELKQKYKEA